MSNLDKDLNDKFGKLNKYQKRTMHGEDVKKGKSYADRLDSNNEFGEAAEADPDRFQDTDSPFKPVLSESTQDEFDDLIQKMKYLTREEKEVIQLLWEGKSQTDAGIILGVKRGTISTYLERARKKIKKLSGKR